MFDYIKKLQKKTPREREQITLFVSLGITFLIFAVWVTAFNPLIVSTSQETRTSGAAPPIEHLQRNFGYFVNDFQNIVEKVQAQFKNTFADEENIEGDASLQFENEKTKDAVGEEEGFFQNSDVQDETADERMTEEGEDFGEDLIKE